MAGQRCTRLYPTTSCSACLSCGRDRPPRAASQEDVRETVDPRALRAYDIDGNQKFDVHEYGNIVKAGQRTVQNRGYETRMKGPAEVVVKHTIGYGGTPKHTPRPTPRNQAAVKLQAASRGNAARKKHSDVGHKLRGDKRRAQA